MAQGTEEGNRENIFSKHLLANNLTEKNLLPDTEASNTYLLNTEDQLNKDNFIVKEDKIDLAVESNHISRILPSDSNANISLDFLKDKEDNCLKKNNEDNKNKEKFHNCRNDFKCKNEEKRTKSNESNEKFGYESDIEPDSAFIKEIELPESSWAWLVAIGTWMIHILLPMPISVYGIIFSGILMNKGSTSDESFDVSAATIGWIFALQQIIWQLAGIFAGPLCAQFGMRAVAFAGSIFCGCSIILSGFATSPAHLYMLYSVMYGFGIGIASPACNFIAPLYFKKRRGFVMGMMMMCFSCATFISPIFVSHIYVFYGYRGARFIMGALILNGCVAAMVFHPVEWHTKKEKCATISEQSPMNLNKSYLPVTVNSSIEKDITEKDITEKEHRRNNIIEKNIENNDLNNHPGVEQHINELSTDENMLECQPVNRLLEINELERRSSAHNILRLNNLKEEALNKRNCISSELINRIAPNGIESNYRGHSAFIHSRYPSYYMLSTASLNLANESLSASQRIIHKLNGQSIDIHHSYFKQLPNPDSDQDELTYKYPKIQSNSFSKLMVNFYHSILVSFSLFKSHRVKIIGIANGLFLAANTNVIMLMPFVLKQNGYSLETAAWVISIGAVSNITSRILVSLTIDHFKFSTRYIFMFGSLCTSISLIAFTLTPNLTLFVISTIIFTFGVGCCMVMQQLLSIEFIGVELYPKTYTINSLLMSTALMLIGPLMGVVRDSTGDYDLTIICLAIVSFMSFVLHLFMPFAIKSDRRRNCAQLLPCQVFVEEVDNVKEV